MMMKLYKNESGFTLIEILIVVLIIGIIAALAIPNLMSARQTAWSQTCFANRSTLTASAELFVIQGGAIAAGTTNILTAANPGFANPVMTAIPSCPATPTIAGSVSYTFPAAASTTVACANVPGIHP